MQKEVYAFISKKTNDPIVERRTCRVSGEEFAIFQSDKAFYEKISPTFGGKKYLIPFPTLCPIERERRRMLFRNERRLYKRRCNLTEKPIISIYIPESPHRVYDQKVWRSDQRDPVDYGRVFEFGNRFVEQFHALLLDVPRPSLGIFDSEDCDYTNEIINCSSCYLIFSGVENQSCLHSHYIDYCKDCIDCDQTISSENCYDCFAVKSCFACKYSDHCRDGQDLEYCSHCENCKHCHGCVGLKNKQYCINNVQYTKDEYIKEITQFLKLEEKKIVLDSNEASWVKSCENSYGTYLLHSKNVHYSNNIQDGEDCKWCLRGVGMKDCYDCFITGVVPNALYVECMTVGPGINNIFTMNSRPHVSHLLYCDGCSNCSHCFGCVGLRNRQYCIFNKQYTKEEYEKIVPQIIEHMMDAGQWGEFFDPQLSPFGYNETVAQEYYPLTKEEALARGYKRQNKEYPINIPEGMDTIEAKLLPTNIDDVDNTILHKAIICEMSGKPFRIIKSELDFYRKHKLPLPTKHPDVRHTERLAKRPGRELHLRTCDKTGEEMLSVYPQDVLFEVYSEEAYRKEVYG